MPSAVSSTASRINCCDAGSELLTRSTRWLTPSTYRTRQVFRHRLAPKVRKTRIKSRTEPMLGFKRFDYAAITIAGVELLRRIQKGQFALGSLRRKDQAALVIWNAVLPA